MIFHILDPKTWIFHILDPKTWIFHFFVPDRAFGSNLGRSETQTPPGNSGGPTSILCTFVHNLCTKVHK